MAGRVLKGKVSPQTLFTQLPAHIQAIAPPYASIGQVPPPQPRIHINNEEQIAVMRGACRVAAQVLQVAGEHVRPGVTTDEIDVAVYEATIAGGHYPSPLNYHGFPKSVCTSINEVVCHGIPDDRPLQEGDIVNCDVSAFVDGHHGDNSAMFLVGEVSDEDRALVDATREALDAAIAECRPGRPLNVVGHAIADVFEPKGYESVKQYCGHGVGQDFHMFPYVHHYRNDLPGEMAAGMIFTIEPMLVTGSAENEVWDDGWTVVTKDGSRSAQFEHTVLITRDGCEVLTVAD
eukprot:g2416.t1